MRSPVRDHGAFFCATTNILLWFLAAGKKRQRQKNRKGRNKKGAKFFRKNFAPFYFFDCRCRSFPAAFSY
jgi:hypothetical protein